MVTLAAQVPLAHKDLLDLLDNLANQAALANLAIPADLDLRERLAHLDKMALPARMEILAHQAIKYRDSIVGFYC